LIHPQPTSDADHSGRRRRHLAIVGGGTAGHVYPALAVAAAYRALQPEAEITFLGTELGFEGKLVPAAGFPLELIPGSPLFGSGLRGKLRAVTNAIAGMRAAHALFERTGTDALLSFGSYASGGPVLAARRLGLPIAICEPNVTPGLTNRLLGRFADAIFLGWPQAAEAFPRRRVRVTGVPIRAELGRLYHSADRPAGTATRILILGGSLGSSFLNRNAPTLMAELARRGHALEIEHQAGASGADSVGAAYRDRSLTATVSKYLDDIVAAYERADLVVTSAGAITLAELAAAALPALVVPLAVASEDHQRANARAFEVTTGCPWTTEEEWQLARVADLVESTLLQPQQHAALRHRLRLAAQLDAATDIARACDRLMALHG
jgi:UDP-N-acetylglucosamine--N-acetylmuramyl-(pentapeptide) pyrophosphoryl-undecaprenol N-acetylglucosamine transferase